MDLAPSPAPDPAGTLADIIHLLEDGARDPAGLLLDPVLCRGLVQGLNEVRDGLGLLTALAEEVQAAIAPPPPPRRPAAARRALARAATPLDPAARVIAFPLSPLAPLLPQTIGRRPMAKAKTKAAGTNLPVPQTDAEAEQLVARLGALQRDHQTAQATHDAAVAALEEKFGLAVKVFQEAQGVIIDALAIWACAHRERLTQGGRTKTVQLPTGTLAWREGSYAVKHRGLKNEDVVTAIRARLAIVNGLLADAKRERRKDDAAALTRTAEVLGSFLRTKVEPNKEAMLAAREVAETVPGITVPRGGEQFVVTPLASQIREVA